MASRQLPILTPLRPRPRWQDQALCEQRGLPMDVMFPSDPHGVKVAKQVCGDCPVRAACLEYALEHNEEFGVWGGTSENERRRIRTRRRIERTTALRAG